MLTCAADHSVQSAAVASGSWQGARGVTAAALRAYVTWPARSIELSCRDGSH